jgi:hypothetical protein
MYGTMARRRAIAYVNRGLPGGTDVKNRFTSVWGEERAKKPSSRPAVASAAADSESGTEGGDSTRQSLRALKVMHDCGLMTDQEYEIRKAEILAGKG